MRTFGLKSTVTLVQAAILVLVFVILMFPKAAFAGEQARAPQALPEPWTGTRPDDDFKPVPPLAFLVRAGEIMDWIVENSDYDGYERLPAFVKLPISTINYIVFSQTREGYIGQESINALYVPHVVLISDDFELESCTHTLVHELVHHLQFETGKSFRCTLEAEREAYEIQAKWVEETGCGELPSFLFMLQLKCDNPHDLDR